MLGRTDRRDHLGEEAVRVVARNSKIGTGRLDGEPKARRPASSNCLKSVAAGKMDDVEMRSGAARQIGRGLNGQSFRDRRMRLFPVGERALGRRLSQVVARLCRPVLRSRNARRRPHPDPAPRLAGILPAGNRRSRTFDDARNSRHVELVGADAVLLRRGAAARRAVAR